MFESSYRLSPQYPYPIPQDDCVEAVEYLIENASHLRIDPKRIAIGGDSAGGIMYNNIRIRDHECEGGIGKICPEDHRLASRGLPSDDKR